MTKSQFERQVLPVQLCVFDISLKFEENNIFCFLLVQERMGQQPSQAEYQQTPTMLKYKVFLFNLNYIRKCSTGITSFLS